MKKGLLGRSDGNLRRLQLKKRGVSAGESDLITDLFSEEETGGFFKAQSLSEKKERERPKKSS